MTSHELWQQDPAAARAIWNEGWVAAKGHAENIEVPRAWNAGFMVGIATALLALILLGLFGGAL